MRTEAAGDVVFEGRIQVSQAKVDDLVRALGSSSATKSATLVPFFGPTVAGETEFVEVLGLDLAKALLGGLSYDWQRPFVVDEVLTAKVFIESVYDKGSNRFGVVVGEFVDDHGQLVQRQTATFIETVA